MKIGISLAGGGVRGAAHLGILQALEEYGIKGDIYTGSSAGSIVATMKALGHDNETCVNMLKGISTDLIDVAYWDIIKALPTKFKTFDGLLKGEKLKSWLSQHIEDTFLMNTKHGLGIVTTDISTGAQVLFSTHKIPTNKLHKLDDNIKLYELYTPLPLYQIVYASCALPLIFKPLSFHNMTLVDGSLTNNLPANVAQAMGADKVIAIDLAKRKPKKGSVKGAGDIIGRSMSTMMAQNALLSINQTKDVIRLNPDVTEVTLLEFDRAEECFEMGYQYGRRVAPLVLKELES